MRRRAVVGAVAGWLTVVGATSAVAWVAIDRAGREVLTAPAAAAGSAAVTTGAPRTPSGAATSAGGPATTTPTPTATAPTSPSSASPGSSGSPTHRTTTSSTHTSAPASRPPAAVDRTVGVQGGQVGVRCAGAAASLRFAQPADGWAVSVDDDGPDRVRVRFSSAAERREIEVEAECSGGTPVFTTSDDDHGDDGSETAVVPDD